MEFVDLLNTYAANNPGIIALLSVIVAPIFILLLKKVFKSPTIFTHEEFHDKLEKEKAELQQKEQELSDKVHYLQGENKAQADIFKMRLSDVKKELKSVCSTLEDPEAYDNFVKNVEELGDKITHFSNQVSKKQIDEAKDALSTNDISKAESLFQYVEEDAEKYIQNAAEAAFQRGIIAQKQARYEDASKHFAKAVRLVDDNLDYINQLELLAISLDELGQYQQAEPLWQKILEIRRGKFGENHPATATSYNDLALSIANQGRHQEAEQLHSKALKIRQDIFGENDPDTVASYNNLAVSVFQQGRYQEAEELNYKVLKIHQDIFGENHPDTAASYNNLALSIANQGRYQEAEQLHSKALKIRQDIFGENHPDTADSYDNLGNSFFDQGRYQEAEQLHSKALKIRQDIFGENHPKTATSYNNLASSIDGQGRYQEAEQLYQTAITIMENIGLVAHPDTQRYKNQLKKLVEKLNDT
jgi:tetratricopeptide (TPR) repeat protein